MAFALEDGVGDRLFEGVIAAPAVNAVGQS